MGWFTTEDPEEFLPAAGGFLRSRPAENTVLLTVTETMRAHGRGAFGEVPPLFSWWQTPEGAVASAFLHTPPYRVLLARAPRQAVTALAETLSTVGRPLPGVSADRETAEAFAAEWQRRTGAAALSRQHQRLYRLGDLTPPRPAPPGRPRLAGPADRSQIMTWYEAFVREIGDARGNLSGAVEDRLAYNGFTLWETGGAPVSLAGVTRRVAGMIRIGPVYTPPELRGRGYAGAATAAVSQAALDAGADEILLFTDLANPTSNALYQRLGYRPVEDRVLLSFTS
jgi:RimJ/RimL family protein N-acetyltransferase